MISVRWWPSSWMQFSSPFFKIVHDTGQQLTIDQMNFLTDGFLKIIQHTGFVSIHAISNTPKGKNHTLKDRESEGATACLWNGKWSAHHTQQTRGAQQAKSPLLLKWPTQRKRMPTTSSPPSQPTEYYPFKRCQVPMGHPVQYSFRLQSVQTDSNQCIYCLFKLQQLLYTQHAEQ